MSPSTSFTLDPAYPLTPSELVFLNGEIFAGKAMLGNMPLLHTDQSVSTSQLGQAVLAAAFLANEHVGAFSLGVAQKKAMLGLRKVKTLTANPGKNSPAWPAGSLESGLFALTRDRYASGKSTEVNDLVYTWLRSDSQDPWTSVLEMLKHGLADRGLLERSEEKKLKIFTKTKFSLPDATAQIAGKANVALVQQILGDCERQRSEDWKLLNKLIKKAISARTEQDDVDFD
ncbi:MAG: hypothetical protein P8074_20315 [Anaerolineales bacterium]|jgi:hypothetical protein